MGCENSNEISNLNQTEPTIRILTVNQNNILSPLILKSLNNI